jgi:hypothetical protein
MPHRSTEAAHAMRRAREEAHLAALADEPAIAHAHFGLSVLHAARARKLLAEKKPGASAFPQFSHADADIIQASALQARVRS